MLRDLALDPLLYLCLDRPSFRFERYVCSGVFLGAEGGLDADDARVGDGRVGEEDGFEFGGSDLEAGDLDEFLLGKGWSAPNCEKGHCEHVQPLIDPRYRTIPSHQ